MLTLFALPKLFQGHFGTIQRNAIASWVRLHPSCEILLFGNEEGTSEVAKEFGIHHVPNVAHNEYGTPLLNGLFEKAQKLANNDLLCYVNCDIILKSDFIKAMEKLRQWRKYFLMVGECWNVDLTKPLDFDQADWEKRLAGLVQQTGKPRGPWYIDYFLFPRGFYKYLPPLVLGRAGFDNWLIWKACALKAPVVDATRVVTAIHQNHDYSHVPGGKNWSYNGEEARHNLKIARGYKRLYMISDATHRLHEAGLRRNFRRYLRPKIYWQRVKPQMLAAGGQCFWWILGLTRPIRHPLGLHMTNFERFKEFVTRQK